DRLHPRCDRPRGQDRSRHRQHHAVCHIHRPVVGPADLVCRRRRELARADHSVMRYLVVVALVACGHGHETVGPSDDAAVIPQPDAALNYSATFRFAVVGDTRPANEDDIAGYPSDVISKIWADVEAQNPHPDFAVATGDYQFSSPTRVPSTVDAQLDLYLRA